MINYILEDSHKLGRKAQLLKTLAGKHYKCYKSDKLYL